MVAKISAKEKVIEMLFDNGWSAGGHTQTETVRIPTVKSPLFGKGGGELATFGGRPRFLLPDSDWRVTVGKITTFFYVIDGSQKHDIHNRKIISYSQSRSFATKDIKAIEEYIKAIKISAEKKKIEKPFQTQQILMD